MPRPTTRPDTFKHPLYPHARCYVDDGIIYTQINEHGKRVRQSTGLQFTGKVREDSAIKKQALAVLEARILRKPEPHRASTQNGMYKLFEAFYKEYYNNNIKQGRAVSLVTVMGYMFTQDMPLVAELLREYITEQRNAAIDTKKYASNTVRKHLQCLRMMFDYAVDRGWIDRNPVAKTMIPKPTKSTPNPLSMRDVDRLVQAISNEEERGEKYKHFKRVALEIRLLALTGMRPIEFISLEWDWIGTDYIELRVTKGNRPRKIPIKIIPNLAQTLSALKAYSHDGRVAVWSNAQNYNDVIRRISVSIGIGKRSLYHLRDTAINWYRDDLKMNPNLSAAIAGNSVQIQKQHYLLELEIEKFLSSVSPE
jgi:site-specific recombinase XerD